MESQASRSARRGSALHLEEGSPSVLSIIAAMANQRRVAMSELRNLTLSLQGVEERTLFDHFCREWTPAYYLQRSQLFHVHNFRSGLRATMFMGANTLAPFILESEEVSPDVRLLVADISAPRGTGMFRVPLTSVEDVVKFMELVRLKWAFVEKGSKGSSRRA